VSDTYWWERASPVGGVLPARRLRVTGDEWLTCVSDLAAARGRLLALWAASAGTVAGHAVVRAAIAGSQGVLVAELALQGVGAATGEAVYPGIGTIFPCALRMQRAAYDTCKVRATDPDRRPWLRHAAWPAGFFPLAPAHGDDAQPAPVAIDDYAFVRVQGEGVHEIPVGPVHAGIIEPGHFRFSVVGEKVLRLEERLGYTHKGVERLFAELGLFAGQRLASRVSGDSTVAYSWAYCQAVEGLTGCRVPPRAAWLRAWMLEIERVANHLGDLGALGGDAGFTFGLAQFSRLKEEWLRAVDAVFERRYLMDTIVPGGTAVDVATGARRTFAQQAHALAGEVRALRQIYDEHEGLRDRFAAAGCATPDLAARLGLTGLAGRASGQAFDARVDWPCAPYDALAPAIVTRGEGDVAARVALRFDELEESCRLIERIGRDLPDGACRAELATPAEARFGLGMVEGWRGPVLVAIDAGPGERVLRCHPHDPSWQNWPVLEHAIIGNIVPDFPLINKSFNLSYSGHDL
jgi:Ni,Fe-hydrogenase III large subunit/Ni,Fe-hydrogenase III component G